MGTKLLQPTLTAGEVSPALHGRVDITRYGSGLRKCRNFIVRPYGGVENRTGFQFVDGARGATVSTGIHRVIPFTYSTEVAYVLVLGDHLVRFLSNGAAVTPATTAWSNVTTYALDQYVTSGGVTYRSLQAGNLNHNPAASPTWWVADAGLQMTTPWAAADIFSLRFSQSADEVYVAHPSYPTRELRRLTANSFEIRLFANKEGPFLDLNPDESSKVAATGTQGTVTVAANRDIFTANSIGSLFYIENKNLGQVKPWVVGDRDVALNALRRSDGKTYRAVTIPAVGTWHETGPRQPVHEAGRAWDGAGSSKTNGVDTWSVGIEWEYVDGGYGVVQILSLNSASSVQALVTKRLPEQVVGGPGGATNTWPLVGDGVTRTFSLPGLGYGVVAVTINGTSVQPDPNYVPPQPGTGGGGQDGWLGGGGGSGGGGVIP
jgi:hypothetical protein